MKIGVIGVGVVGGAVKKALEAVGKYDVVGYDPNKEEFKDVSRVLDAELLFICVPTSTAHNGTQDKLPLYEVGALLKEHEFKGVACVKSTVLPGTTKFFAEHYGLRAVHNPEFLTAKDAYADLISQEAILVSGDVADVKIVVDVNLAITTNNPSVEVVAHPEFHTTELAKYGHNLFLALKVSAFNEIYEACATVGAEFEAVRSMMLAQNQIEPGHTQVPGPDGKMGFGGECFPKDSKAYVAWAKDKLVPTEIFEAMIVGNTRRRS